MNRVELKEKAKGLIKGNIWYILKPAVIWFLITFVAGIIAGCLDYAFESYDDFAMAVSEGTISSIISLVFSIFSAILSVGYAKYILTFIRGGRSEIKDIIDFAKENWKICILVSFVAGLNVALGMILLIVPGIIAAFGLTFYKEVVADNPELGTTDALRKAWEVTNGHKFDLFVLGLSFIGWCILASLTFGILYIWLVPYMTVTFALAYDSLK